MSDNVVHSLKKMTKPVSSWCFQSFSYIRATSHHFRQAFLQHVTTDFFAQ